MKRLLLRYREPIIALVIMISIIFLLIYAGIGYYPFNLFPENLMKWIAYIMFGAPIIVAPIQLFLFTLNLIKLKKALKEDKATKENFKELKSLLKRKLVSIGLFLITFSTLLYVLMVYWVFKTDIVALVIGRVTAGALISMIIIFLPVMFFITNDKHYKTIELICMDYLLDKQEIIELVKGNIEMKALSITYFSKKDGNPKEAQSKMIIYNKNNQSDKGLIVNLKLSIGANETTWQVTEMTYAKAE